MSRLTILMLLAFGPVLINGLFGCNDCSPSPFRYGISDYQAYPRKTKPNGQFETANVSDTLSYQETELVLVGKTVQVAFQSHLASGSSVLACSQVEIAQDKIRSLVVTSDKDYSAEFPSGRNLAPLLTIGTSSYDQKPLLEFLASENPDAKSFLSLRFAQGPTAVASHQFSVVVDLGKGELTRFETKPVILKP